MLFGDIKFNFLQEYGVVLDDDALSFTELMYINGKIIEMQQKRATVDALDRTNAKYAKGEAEFRQAMAKSRAAAQAHANRRRR